MRVKLNQEKSSFNDRFRIDQKGVDDPPRSENIRYSKRRTSGVGTIKLIALGGGIIVLIAVVGIIFNLGTRPESKTSSPPKANNAAMISLLEQRMGQLEKSLEEISKKISSSQNVSPDLKTNLVVFTGRLDRLENAMSTKFGILSDNIDKLDVQMGELQKHIKKMEASSNDNSLSQKVSKTQTAEEKTHKGVKKTSDSRVYHVVKKGETLYHISKNYGTTVTTINTLNHFSKQHIIHPGDKLIVK